MGSFSSLSLNLSFLTVPAYQGWLFRALKRAESIPMFSKSLAEIMNTPITPLNWVVDGLLLHGGTSIIAASPKVGKSSLLRQLVADIATGRPFLGRTTKQGTVLLLALEDQEGPVREHFRLLEVEPDCAIHLATRMPVEQSRPIEQLRKEILGLGDVGLVVIDTLQRFACLQDTNDYSDVAAFMAEAAELAADTGTHITFAHHTKKRRGDDAAANTLGSTAFVGGVDTAMELRVTPGGQRELRSSQRCGESMEPTLLVRDSETGMLSLSDSVQIIRERASQAKARDFKSEILALVSLSPDIDRTSLLANIRGDAGLKQAALMELIEDGVVDRIGTGGKGSPFKYRPALLEAA